MLVSIAVAATGQATSPRRYNFESQVSGPSCSCHLPGSHKTELGLKEGRGGRGEAGQGVIHPRKKGSSSSLGHFFLSSSSLPMSSLVSWALFHSLLKAHALLLLAL